MRGSCDYIRNDDEIQIYTFADIETIPNAGYWLPAEQSELLLEKIIVGTENISAPTGFLVIFYDQITNPLI